MRTKLNRHVLTLPATAAMVTTGVAAGQPVISARSGILIHMQGRVPIAGKPLVRTRDKFPEIQEGKESRTEKGRAEVLPGPGVFLRVDEDSAMKMMSNRLTVTRAEVLAGSAILECRKLPGDSSITVIFGDAQATFRRRGVYRIDAGERLLRVYDGQAVVVRGGETLTLNSAKQVQVAGKALDTKEFSTHIGDSFLRWAVSRSEDVGMTNCVAAARAIYTIGETPSGNYWYYDSICGAAYMPSRDYCREFRGPLHYLGARMSASE